MQTRFPEHAPFGLADRRSAFTLVELIVSTGIIALIMLVLVQMTNQTSKTWRSTSEKVEKFEEARDGFEALTRRLSQATLNTNWDYLGILSSGSASQNLIPRPKLWTQPGFKTFVPVSYGRTADLRFMSGPMSFRPGGQGITNDPSAANTSGVIFPTHGVFFQAPLGMATNTAYDTMNNILNTWGYFIQAGWDPNVPAFVATMQQPYANSSSGTGLVRKRWRSRLMEFRQPSEQMSLYDPASDSSKYPHWFTVPLMSTGSPYTGAPANPPTRAIAENIVALIIRPRLSKNDEDYYNSIGKPWMLCSDYVYDSTQTINPGPYSPGSNTAQINPKNQLPPIVNVTMVAIDERSAKRLDERYGTGPNGQNQGSWYMGLDQAVANVPGGTCPQFKNLFTNQNVKDGGGIQLEGPLGPPNSLGQTDESDLNYLQQILIHAMDLPGAASQPEPITYRIFTSNVTIKGAKWSRLETE